MFLSLIVSLKTIFLIYGEVNVVCIICPSWPEQLLGSSIQKEKGRPLIMTEFFKNVVEQ